MATNLRLRPETASALRKESERSGQSQQELIRQALNHYLGLTSEPPHHRSLDELLASGVARPPREPFRRAQKLLSLPTGVSTVELLDRHDRL